LQNAARISEAEAMRVLLKHHDHFKTQTALQNAALCEASSNGYTSIVRLLLNDRADVHACGTEIYDSSPDFAFRMACYKGHTETARLLLKAKANVHGDGDDALRWAAYNGYSETVRVLLVHKADAHAPSPDGRPADALHWAVRNGCTVRVLLAHKADVHACSRDGTPNGALLHASSKNFVNLTEILLQAGPATCIAQLDPAFVAKHLNAPSPMVLHDDIAGTVEKTARCLRLGLPILRAMFTSTNHVFDMETFLLNRKVVLETIEATCSHGCHDLNKLILLYV